MGKTYTRLLKEKKENFSPLVYICAPLKGDVLGNTKNALRLSELAYKKGAIPITPHILFPFLDDDNAEERKRALFMDLVLMGKCQEVWVLGNKLSQGMKKELQIAGKRKQKIRYFDNNLEEVDYDKNSFWK